MPKYDNNGNYADPMEQLQHEFRVWREHLIERVFSGRHAWQSHEDISEQFEQLVNRIPLATQTFPALDESEYKYQLRELVESIAPYGDTGTQTHRAYFSAEILEASIRMLEEKPTPKYVHQFLTPTGWDTSTNDDGTPSTFDTQAEAAAELEIFHDEVAAAVSRGDMDDHNRADWRVAELEG